MSGVAVGLLPLNERVLQQRPVLVIASGAHRIDTNKVSSARANEFAVDSCVVDTVHTANPADCRLQ